MNEHEMKQDIGEQVATGGQEPLPCYFSYDPDHGLHYHDTPEEAKDRAERSYLSAENALDDLGGSDDLEDHICWGRVFGHVASHDRPLTEEEKEVDPEGDFVRELEWVDVAPPERFTIKPLVWEPYSQFVSGIVAETPWGFLSCFEGHGGFIWNWVGGEPRFYCVPTLEAAKAAAETAYEARVKELLDRA